MIRAYFTSRKYTTLKIFLPALFICSLLTGMPDSTMATTKMLMMSPVRAIFTDRQRSVNVKVINLSEVPISYNISVVTMRKGEGGRLYEPEIETEEELAIKKMIRFSPRRATIEKGKRQLVKLMVRKPKDLPPGEYQARLRLSPQPQTSSTYAEAGNNEYAGSSVNLNITVDSTFPIIIQHGGLEADITPLNILMKEYPKAPAGLAADVTFSRSGDCSAFGDVFLTFIPSDNPKDSRVIGKTQGLAIYLPDTERTITVPLNDINQQELSNGRINVAFHPNRGVVEKRKRKKDSQIRSKDFTLP